MRIASLVLASVLAANRVLAEHDPMDHGGEGPPLPEVIRLTVTADAVRVHASDAIALTAIATNTSSETVVLDPMSKWFIDYTFRSKCFTKKPRSQEWWVVEDVARETEHPLTVLKPGESSRKALSWVQPPSVDASCGGTYTLVVKHCEVDGGGHERTTIATGCVGSKTLEVEVIDPRSQ